MSTLTYLISKQPKLLIFEFMPPAHIFSCNWQKFCPNVINKKNFPPSIQFVIWKLAGGMEFLLENNRRVYPFIRELTLHIQLSYLLWKVKYTLNLFISLLHISCSVCAGPGAFACTYLAGAFPLIFLSHWNLFPQYRRDIYDENIIKISWFLNIPIQDKNFKTFL